MILEKLAQKGIFFSRMSWKFIVYEIKIVTWKFGRNINCFSLRFRESKSLLITKSLFYNVDSTSYFLFLSSSFEPDVVIGQKMQGQTGTSSTSAELRSALKILSCDWTSSERVGALTQSYLNFQDASSQRGQQAFNPTAPRCPNLVFIFDLVVPFENIPKNFFQFSINSQF